MYVGGYGGLSENDSVSSVNCVQSAFLYVVKVCRFVVICSYVCCSESNVVSNECNEPTSCLVQPIGTHGGEVMYFAGV